MASISANSSVFVSVRQTFRVAKTNDLSFWKVPSVSSLFSVRGVWNSRENSSRNWKRLHATADRVHFDHPCFDNYMYVLPSKSDIFAQWISISLNGISPTDMLYSSWIFSSRENSSFKTSFLKRHTEIEVEIGSPVKSDVPREERLHENVQSDLSSSPRKGCIVVCQLPEAFEVKILPACIHTEKTAIPLIWDVTYFIFWHFLQRFSTNKLFFQCLCINNFNVFVDMYSYDSSNTCI